MLKKTLLAPSFIMAFILALTLTACADEATFKVKNEPVIGTLTGVTSLNDWLYMAGQPDQATIAGLSAKGFEVVINIRGRDEVRFDEKTLVEKNGMAYYNVPLLKNGEMQEAAVIDILAVVVANKDKKILFHCSSGNRIAAWLAAHMIRDHDYETEAAITLAKQTGMTKASAEQMLRNYLAKIAK